MAKGQMRSGREAKKPKADKKVAAPAGPDPKYQLPSRIAASKASGKTTGKPN